MSGHLKRNRIRFAATLAFCALFASGCGTTKWSDTSRTGTEQLLISNAIDSAVGKINFRPLGDKRVYLEAEAIGNVTDSKYLKMALRQHMAASGGIICDVIDDADYVVEVRAGAVGTDRDEMLLLGIPAMTLPAISDATISQVSVPEIPIVKRTRQRGVAKLAVFAYNKHTGRPIWASGNNQSESSAQNLWFAGSGPLTKGTIYDETTYAGHSVPKFMQSKSLKRQNSFADRAQYFREHMSDPNLKDVQQAEKKEPETSREVAAAEQPLAPSAVPPATPAAPQGPYAVPAHLLGPMPPAKQ